MQGVKIHPSHRGQLSPGGDTDEPTGALDRRTGDQVLEVLRGAAKRFMQTLVLVTHDPHVAATADEVLFLADGRLAGKLLAPTSSQIAARLVVGEGAVEKHVTSIFQKLDLAPTDGHRRVLAVLAWLGLPAGTEDPK